MGARRSTVPARRSVCPPREGHDLRERGGRNRALRRFFPASKVDLLESRRDDACLPVSSCGQPGGEPKSSSTRLDDQIKSFILYADSARAYAGNYSIYMKARTALASSRGCLCAYSNRALSVGRCFSAARDKSSESCPIFSPAEGRRRREEILALRYRAPSARQIHTAPEGEGGRTVRMTPT